MARIRTEVIATACVLAAMVTAAGCRSPSSTDGRRYTHRGMHFALDVPAGWTLEELEGDMVVELRGPLAGERARATAHVYSRREPNGVDLDAVVARFLELETGEAALLPAAADRSGEEGDAAEPPGAGAECEAPPAREPVEVSGLPAWRVTRRTKAGATLLEEDILVVARGRQVWALLIAVPESAGESSAEAVAELKRSFTVW